MEQRRRRLEVTEIFSFTKEDSQEAKKKINSLVKQFVDDDLMNDLRIDLGRRRRLGAEEDDEPVYSLSIEWAIIEHTE